MIMRELELIRLYFYLCECNNNLLSAYCQRFSRNASPNNEKLTDAELLTIYFYCRRYEGKQSKTTIYDYAQRYLKSWCPDLPAFANFNSRLNNLGCALPYLVAQMLDEVQSIENQDIDGDVSLIDSLPNLPSGSQSKVFSTGLLKKPTSKMLQKSDVQKV